MQENSWVSRNILSNENYKILLDESFEKIDSVPGLKTKLYLHQQTVVKAMLDLENNRIFNLMYGDLNLHVKVNSGILSEPVGSGKTIAILSLILLQKTPKKYRDTVYLYDVSYKKKFKCVLAPTLIFVGVSVLTQWKEAITTFTYLKVLVISGIGDLDALIHLIQNDKKELNTYDIILIKNGSISRLPSGFDPGMIEFDNMRCTQYIYNIIANYKLFTWSRIIIDDFDTIRMHRNSIVINSLFTWYISSTSNISYFNDTMINVNVKNTTDLLLYNRTKPNILEQSIVVNNFNVRNTNEFIQKSINMVKPDFYVYLLKNPNNGIIDLMNGIDIPNIKDVMEMLNSDSIESAAEKVGIKSNTVMGVFEHILGEQYDLFKQSVQILNFIDNQLNNKASWASNEDKLTYNKKDLLSFTEIKIKYPNINNLLEKAIDEFTEVKNTSRKIIERVRGNMQENECPICVLELSKTDMVIFKCCNLIICGQCCCKSVFSNGQLRGSCCKCRSKVAMKDLVYLNNIDLNYEKLLENFQEEKTDIIFMEDTKLEETCDNENYSAKKIEQTKISTVLDIILSNDISYRKKIDVNIQNLMNFNSGDHIEEKIYKKILIFANYDEILDRISYKLKEKNIVYDILCGTYDQINNIVKRFKSIESDMVLIINSMKHCSGLNLQVATDIIFVHYIINQDVEAQVIGRGLRLGRTSALQVHYVLYENEYNNMIYNNRIIRES